MPTVADQAEAPIAIQTHLACIFTSLELSRSVWLITSLSPGSGEKMSKHSVRAGDVAALLARFSELKRKASERTGKSFPIVVIQEAGLDGFIRRRLRAILRKQEKRPAFGLCPEDHRRWSNAFFADIGLFSLSTARYEARLPR